MKYQRTTQWSMPLITMDQVKGDTGQVRQRFLAAGADSVVFLRVTDQRDFVKEAPASMGSMDMAAVDESRYNALTQPGGEAHRFQTWQQTLPRVGWSGHVEWPVEHDDGRG